MVACRESSEAGRRGTMIQMISGDLLHTLEEVVERLDVLRIEFMVTGSLALGYYVEPRMTRDIALVIELEGFDPAAFIRAFRDGYYVPDELVLGSNERGSMFNIIRESTVVKVDFVVRREGEFRALEFSRRRRITLGAVECPVVSPKDLILSKLIWSEESASPVQLHDVKALVQLGELDHEYLHQWAGRLGVDEMLRNLNDEI